MPTIRIMSNLCFKDILFVIVLYHRKLKDCETYHTLIKNYPQQPLFIYDNSSFPQQKASDFDEHICYISDVSNSGLSVAYNRAADYARQKGYTWLLLLDQDTVFSTNILDEYNKIINQCPEIKLIVPPMKVNDKQYMSPVKVRFHMAALAKSVPAGKVSLHRYAPINSGMAINVEAFHQVGGYNEKVKLDFSDFQFVERLRKFYPDFYVLNGTCFQHFSNVTESEEQKLHRFGIFCDCLKNCDRINRFDNVFYFLVVIKRMFALIFSTGCFKPFFIVFTKFFK